MKPFFYKYCDSLFMFTFILYKEALFMFIKIWVSNST